MMTKIKKPKTTDKDKHGMIDESDRLIWQQQVTEYVKQQDKLNKNIKTLFSSLIWGKCSDYTKQKLEASEVFNEIETEKDGLKLLLLIKRIPFNNQQSQKFPIHALHEVKRRFYSMRQGARPSTQDYNEYFINTVDFIEHRVGSIGEDALILQLIAKEKGISIKNAEESCNCLITQRRCHKIWKVD